ncbi:MAG: hypothetical protein AB8G77_18725 [Rhodothermales bacterium]
MSPSRRKSKGTKSRRTKDQILQELEVTQRLLIEKEEELVVCQEELAHLIQDDGQSVSDEMPAFENSEITSDTIEALKGEVQRLENQLNNKNNALANEQRERKELDKKLLSKEEEIARLYAALDSQPETSRTPRADDQAESPDADNAADQVQETTAPAAASTIHPTTPHLTITEKTTVPIKIAPFAEIVQQNQPFTAEIAIDMAHIAESNSAGLHCRTKLFAKRLSDGWSGLLGEHDTVFSGKELINAQVSEIELSAGLYHLQAIASFTTLEGIPIPIAAIHEGELLEVATAK